MKQFGDVLPFIQNRRKGHQRAATLRQTEEILTDAQTMAAQLKILSWQLLWMQVSQWLGQLTPWSRWFPSIEILRAAVIYPKLY